MTGAAGRAGARTGEWTRLHGRRWIADRKLAELMAGILWTGNF